MELLFPLLNAVMDLLTINLKITEIFISKISAKKLMSVAKKSQVLCCFIEQRVNHSENVKKVIYADH